MYSSKNSDCRSIMRLTQVVSLAFMLVFPGCHALGPQTSAIKEDAPNYVELRFSNDDGYSADWQTGYDRSKGKSASEQKRVADDYASRVKEAANNHDLPNVQKSLAAHLAGAIQASQGDADKKISLEDVKDGYVVTVGVEARDSSTSVGGGALTASGSFGWTGTRSVVYVKIYDKNGKTLGGVHYLLGTYDRTRADLEVRMIRNPYTWLGGVFVQSDAILGIFMIYGNGDTYCAMQNPHHITAYGGVGYVNYLSYDFQAGRTYTGVCAWPPGMFRYAGDGAVWLNHGNGDYCMVADQTQFTLLGGNAALLEVPPYPQSDTGYARTNTAGTCAPVNEGGHMYKVRTGHFVFVQDLITCHVEGATHFRWLGGGANVIDASNQSLEEISFGRRYMGKCEVEAPVGQASTKPARPHSFGEGPGRRYDY